MKKSPRILTQIGAQEPQRVFKIPALRLEMMGAEMHAFRPDDARQKLHRRETTVGESWRSVMLPNRYKAKVK
jgi:hypothetical protein